MISATEMGMLHQNEAGPGIVTLSHQSGYVPPRWPPTAVGATGEPEQRPPRDLQYRATHELSPPVEPAPIVVTPAPVSFTEKLKSRKWWAMVISVIAQLGVLVPVFHLPPQWAAAMIAFVEVVYIMSQAMADIATKQNVPITPLPTLNVRRSK